MIILNQLENRILVDTSDPIIQFNRSISSRTNNKSFCNPTEVIRLVGLSAKNDYTSLECQRLEKQSANVRIVSTPSFAQG